MHILSNIWNSVLKITRWIASYAKKHKIIAGIVVLVLIGIGWWGYQAYTKANTASMYTLAYASEGPLQVTVTDSGQVSAEHQLNLAPQASAQVMQVNVTPGQTVKAGTIVAELDLTNPEQAIRTARENLQSAQISYQQTLTSSQNTASSDQVAVNTANTNTANAISSAYSGLASMTAQLDTTLHGISTLTGYTAEENVDAYANYINTTEAQQYRDQVEREYQSAMSAYQSSLSAYSAYNVTTATPEQTQQLANTSLNALQQMSQVTRDALAYYNYIYSQSQTANKNTLPSQLSSQITTLTTNLTTLNSDISSITSANTSLKNAVQTLAQDTQSMNNSSTSLTVQSAQLNVQKAQDALTQAEQDEQNYIVRAPFDGTIASVPVKKYDQASSGTTVAVLVTNEEYVDISANEADAAKLQVGQKATLTFDAIPNLTMSGTVAEIDQVGTVSQGVVTYDVKIGLDSEDPRVKPGMTAQAVIVTSSKQDAIQVPNAAVHTTNGVSYVEVATVSSSTLAAQRPAGNGAGGNAANRARFASSTALRMASTTGTSTGIGNFGSSTGAVFARSLTLSMKEVTVTRVPVTLGISNDAMTEITTGISRGDLVVTGTKTAAAAKTTTTTNAGFGGARPAGAATGVRPAGGGGAAVLRGG